MSATSIISNFTGDTSLRLRSSTAAEMKKYMNSNVAARGPEYQTPVHGSRFAISPINKKLADAKIPDTKVHSLKIHNDRKVRFATKMAPQYRKAHHVGADYTDNVMSPVQKKRGGRKSRRKSKNGSTSSSGISSIEEDPSI